MLADGYHDVPDGKIAMVVTHLEMTAPAARRGVPAPEGWSLRRLSKPTLDWYRDIYARVGAEWLWFSRLQMPDAELADALHDPKVHVYTLTRDGADEALMELDFREDGACELAFFGLTDRLIGTGAGRYLMDNAIAAAWAEPISLFHVHTCTVDSPQALGFYMRSGFIPKRRQIEIADDPRLTAGFDPSLAAHTPLIRG